MFILTTSISVVGQQKLTLEEIWSGAFRTKSMDELNAMKNTNQYTVLNFDRNSKTTQIDLFDYATLNKVATLIDTKDFKELEESLWHTFFTTEEECQEFCDYMNKKEENSGYDYDLAGKLIKAREV